METKIAAIQHIIDLAEHYRSAYFWHAPTSASSRRYEERKNSIDTIEWAEGGHMYTASYTVRCSCRNIYASGNYTRDGRKTTLTAIKNSLARLRAAANTPIMQ